MATSVAIDSLGDANYDMVVVCDGMLLFDETPRDAKATMAIIACTG